MRPIIHRIPSQEIGEILPLDAVIMETPLSRRLAPLQKSLNSAKSTMDSADNKLLATVAYHQEPLGQINQALERVCRCKITNAWRKLYEMIIDLPDVLPLDDTITTFDNASLPGAWLLCLNHIIRTRGPSIRWNWYASSLIEPTEDNSALEDRYGLYRRHKENWLMQENCKKVPLKVHKHRLPSLPKNYCNNGNVISLGNQLDFERVFTSAERVDLYTSDLGMDSTEDYNRQEEQQAAANFCQVVTALLTLKTTSDRYKTGNMITKQYTHFLPWTQSIIALVSGLFEETYLVKPPSSRAGNSETYIVAIGFKGLGAHREPLLRLVHQLEHQPFNPGAFIPNTTPEFDEVLFQVQTTIAEAQITVIEERVAAYKELIKVLKDKRVPTTDRRYINRWLSEKFSRKREQIREWGRKYRVPENRTGSIL
jgi:23S rRNA U2552 (ribose-2'-O)-methylase RlmE/FtsJ